MSSKLKQIASTGHEVPAEALIQVFEYAKVKSLFYQRLFKNEYLEAKDFSLRNFKKLPFTNKEDISESNLDFLAVSLDKVADYSTTSGTSGDSITVFLSKDDLENLGRNEADSFELAGATSKDVFQLMTTMDKQFMAGLAYYLGAQRLNAGMIRVGPGLPAYQWKSIILYKPTILIGVPSFIVTLLEYAENQGIEFSKTSVRKIICIGEAIREDDFSLNVLGKRITDKWNVELFSTYASTEMAVAFTECKIHNGNHLNSELLFLEVINEFGEDAEDGSIGEIVITTLKREAMPLLRYRTGDLARVYRAPCKCGNTAPRIGRILGRKNQMIKFKGTTIFPAAIFEIFDSLPNNWLYKVEISKDNLDNDKIIIYLQEEMEQSSEFGIVLEKCKSNLKVVPYFVFENADVLYRMIFNKDLRKPEKIVFK